MCIRDRGIGARAQSGTTDQHGYDVNCEQHLDDAHKAEGGPAIDRLGRGHRASGMLFANVPGAQKREHLNEKRQQQVEEIVARKCTRGRAVRRIGNVESQNDRSAYDEGLRCV